MPAPKEPEKDDLPRDIIILLAGLAIISLIVARINEYLSSLGFDYRVFFISLWDYLLAKWPYIKTFLAFVSILAFLGILSNVWKLRRLNIEESLVYGVNPTLSPAENFREKNERWERIINLSNSTNESDWRLAIIEADGMLDELLRTAGYHGESTGEMLKAVEKSDFLTLDQAWEAHKVRNKIAHAKGDFQLNQRETKRVISLFEIVFKEFEMI